MEDDDYIDFYEYNAVINNRIDTIRVSAWDDPSRRDAPLSFKSGVNISNYPYGSRLGDPSVSSDAKYSCILLNTTTYNTDDILTAGSFTGDVSANIAHGIKRVSGSVEDIKLNTFPKNGELSLVFDDGVRVYYSNEDGEIEEIDVADIRSDNNDWIYYTEDDGEITYLFIQEVDDDDAELNKPTVPGGGVVGLNKATALNIEFYYGESSKDVNPGEKIWFKVTNGGVAQTNADIVSVDLTYTDNANAPATRTATYSGNGYWTVVIPAGNQMAAAPAFGWNVYD